MNPSSTETLRERLTDPAAYPHPVDEIQIRQTHTSLVFLTDSLVYKLKKPVEFGFLDYSTLDKRKFYCEQEVRLNRRLAPDVYLGVVPITEGNGHLQVDGPGEIREWTVKMKRLPDAATLEHRVRSDSVRLDQLRAVARKLARFHEDARSTAEISSYGRFEVVARNAMQNFEQTAEHAGEIVSRQIFERVRSLTRDALDRHRPLIERRADNDIPRDTHGDLRLEHVYLLPAGPTPETITIVDCIEFSNRFRYADPVADMAFLVMDLKRCGRRRLASTFVDAYFENRPDPEGSKLLPLYTSYRSVVRAKVVGIRTHQAETSTDEGERLVRQAAGHWLLALDILESPERRPALLLMSGLPGTGKSTLARGIAEKIGFDVIRTDTVRQELRATADPEHEPEDRYTKASKNAVYEECLDRARSALFEGNRVIVDATFHDKERRSAFIEMAREMGVRIHLLICTTPREVIRKRLAERTNSASDADWDVYRTLEQEWDPPTDREQPITRTISTALEPSESLTRALDYLSEVGLV